MSISISRKGRNEKDPKWSLSTEAATEAATGFWTAVHPYLLMYPQLVSLLHFVLFCSMKIRRLLLPFCFSLNKELSFNTHTHKHAPVNSYKQMLTQMDLVKLNRSQNKTKSYQSGQGRVNQVMSVLREYMRVIIIYTHV